MSILNLTDLSQSIGLSQIKRRRHYKTSLIKQLHYKIQRIFMSVPNHSQASQLSSLCSECQTFYGSQVHHGLCSSCFKKRSQDKKIQIAPLMPEKVFEVLQVPEKIEVAKEELQKDKKRCFACSKKVGLLGTECKCTLVFCNAHRLPESHSCNYDFRQKGQKELQKTVFKVSNGKIIKL